MNAGMISALGLNGGVGEFRERQIESKERVCFCTTRFMSCNIHLFFYYVFEFV